MKKLIPSILFLLFITQITRSQNLAKQWDYTYGGDLPETMTSLMKTSDGGFLLGGFAMSDSGYDVSQPSQGGRDFWIVKTDSLGQKLWDKRYGGDFEDRLFSFDQTSDGGYILGGFTTSDSIGDVSQHTRGSMDYWIVRIDSVGNKLWDKRFGGASYDQLSAVRQSPDGGFILGGWSFSDSTGDVSQHTRGAEDFWVVKTDSAGNKIWDKRFGGDQNDELSYIENSTDGGYILGGRCGSDAGADVSQASRGLTDYWLVKIDIFGNKIWDKRFGGDASDVFLALDITSDGGYVLGGYTQSRVSGDVSESSRDTAVVDPTYMGDIWIVKTNSNGILQWDKRYGGDQKEDAFGYIKQLMDGGYIFASASYSGASGDKTENNLGMEQSWLVKLDSSGNKKWDKTIYTNGEDEFAYPLEVNDSCYVIGNWSYGDSAGYKSDPSRGGYDYWIVKFCESAIPQLPVAGFTVSNNVLCSGGCFSFENLSYNAGNFEWFFPGADNDYSTDVSPVDICYQDTGHYTVTLVASNPSGTDTLVETNLIYIAPLPEFNIVRNGDTLFAPANYVSYQWYFNGSPLFFDTLYYYNVTQTGDYTVSVVDSFGCPGSEGILNVTVGMSDLSANRYMINVFPNPAQNYLNVSGLEISREGKLRISDVSGREVYSTPVTNHKLQIPVSTLVPGIYILQVESGSQKMYLRFIKQ
jgi:PKD repeat protein